MKRIAKSLLTTFIVGLLVQSAAFAAALDPAIATLKAYRAEIAALDFDKANKDDQLIGEVGERSQAVAGEIENIVEASGLEKDIATLVIANVDLAIASVFLGIAQGEEAKATTLEVLDGAIQNLVAVNK